ncbi:putative hydrolase [Sphingobium sp. SYK-6]|nr:putative hydrolase [Sphingobium sp. SYK-6]
MGLAWAAEYPQQAIMSAQATLDFFPGHDGVRIAVHRLGEGRPVLLLHGLSSSAQINWIRYGTAARLAEAGFEAIMIDQRVHGRSDTPADAAAYPQDVMLLDMEAVIPALGLDSFDLAGYSMGSRICTALVTRGLAPRRLVLGGMGLEGLLDWAPRRQFFLDALDRFDIARAGDRDFMAIQFMKTIKVDREALRHLLLSMPNISEADLAAVTMPTLVLSGSEDRDNGSAQALAQALPNAEYWTVPGNHMSCITLPDFGEAIVRYLAA